MLNRSAPGGTNDSVSLTCSPSSPVISSSWHNIYMYMCVCVCVQLQLQSTIPYESWGSKLIQESTAWLPSTARACVAICRRGHVSDNRRRRGRVQSLTDYSVYWSWSDPTHWDGPCNTGRTVGRSVPADRDAVVILNEPSRTTRRTSVAIDRYRVLLDVELIVSEVVSSDDGGLCSNVARVASSKLVHFLA